MLHQSISMYWMMHLICNHLLSLSCVVDDKDTVNLYDVRITLEDVVRVTASTIGFKSETESQEELENALQVLREKT